MIGHWGMTMRSREGRDIQVQSAGAQKGKEERMKGFDFPNQSSEQKKIWLLCHR